MSKGTSLFVIISCLVGAFGASAAQCPQPTGTGCYFLTFPALERRELPIRTPDITSDEIKLRVTKIRLLGEEKDVQIKQGDRTKHVFYCLVETIASGRGGESTPTKGWIERTFIGKRAITCASEAPLP
jgi:hypothetical protein